MGRVDAYLEADTLLPLPGYPILIFLLVLND